MKVLRVVLLPIVCAVSLLAAACTPTPTGGGTGSNIAPIAVANADTDSGQAPLLVRFSSVGSQDADGFVEEYSWNFGDGSAPSAAPNPTHTYTRGGVFTATLTVTDDGGRSASAATVVVVTPPDNLSPVAAITASTLAGKAPLAVDFGSTGSNDPDGVLVAYDWDFGDGDRATTSSASHTYLVPGTYVVTLTVTDNDGAVNTDSTIVAVSTNLVPVARAVATPVSGKAPLTASFDGSTSTDEDGNVVAYDWDFADGGTGTGEVAVHTFTAVGTYEVELTVTDDDGGTDTTTVTVQVNAPQAPVAVANATPDGTKAPLGVVFSSAGSTDNDGSIIGYSWDFGDGTPASTSANPSHLYTSAGTFDATLTVTDDDFLTTTATVPVIVGPSNVPPVAAGTATPAVGKPVLNVQFSAATSTDSDGTVESYSWDFGDGSEPSTDPSPSHTYDTLGTYSVLLTVTDNDGAINTVAIPVSVIPNVPPTAQPVATPRIGKEPLQVDLSAATSGDSDGRIESYAWDYTSDGTVDSTDVETSHEYVEPGNYIATLTVTDEDGASDTSTVTITVNENQGPTAVANANFQSGNAPFSVVFEGRDSLDAELEGTITYDWDFGDGSANSSSSNPTHVFQEIGTYTVTLTVTDDNGVSDTATLTINALDPVVRVRPSGSDESGDGTVGAPYATIQGGIAGAVAQGKTIVKVAGGSYTGFTAASGVSVVGGFDQDFVAGGSNGATAVSVTAGAGASALTVSSLAAPLTIQDLTLVGGGGENATAALVIGSTVTFDGVTVDSGVASGTGSSAYGIRAIDGSNITVTDSSVRARDGLAGEAGTAGTAGAAGANGGNGASGNGSGGKQRQADGPHPPFVRYTRGRQSRPDYSQILEQPDRKQPADHRETGRGQGLAAGGVAMLVTTKQDRRQGRGEAQRIAGRDHGAGRDREGKLAVELAAEPGDEGRRYEHGTEHQRNRDHRTGDFRHRPPGRLAGGEPLRQPAFDVLHDHNGVVDDNADRQHKTEEREIVEREPKQLHDGKRANQRHRHGDHRDDRGPPRLEKHEHHDEHQHDRLEERLVDLVDALLHELRRVVVDGVLESRWKFQGELLHRLPHARRGRQRIRSRPLKDGDRGALATVEPAGHVVALGTEFDPADVGEPDDLAAGHVAVAACSGRAGLPRLHDHVGKLGGRGESSGRVDR